MPSLTLRGEEERGGRRVNWRRGEGEGERFGGEEKMGGVAEERYRGAEERKRKEER